MSEKLKEVEKMITNVMKHRELSRAAAIDYMLGVATGRLLALGRYTSTLPDGKKTKGILALAGRKKRAEKSPKISTLAPPAENSEKSDKPAKKRKAKKRKPKPAAESEQLDVAAQ